MSCECQSARRDLVISGRDLDDDAPILDAAEKFGWQIATKYDAVRVPISEKGTFQSVDGVIDFLISSAAAIDPDEFKGVLMKPRESIEDNISKLIHSQPLEELREGTGKIHEILVNERITTHFQSIVDSDQNIWGFECLMRAKTKEGETISPVEVIEAAHEEALQFRLDRLCRETHLKNAAREDLFDDYKICINFLPTSIYEPEFCLRTTVALANELGIPHEQVIFEVVETENVKEREHLIGILNEYRNKGFGIGLDDVGAGYSSLGFLGDLQPDLIKIDMDIVSGVGEDSHYLDIVDSLVNIGERIGSTVLAEGVEEPEQFEILEDRGVDLFQGYSFGRPNATPQKKASLGG